MINNTWNVKLVVKEKYWLLSVVSEFSFGTYFEFLRIKL
jgi:hypothetical protein